MKYFSHETAGAVAVCFYYGQVLCKSCMKPRAEERLVCSTRADGAHGVTRPTRYHLGITVGVVFDAQGGSGPVYYW